MPLHDWTRVDDGTFHDFHTSWIAHCKGQLNAGLLPHGYYAAAEQVIKPIIPDVLTLRVPPTLFDPPHPNGGGVAVVTPPPQTRRVERLAVATPVVPPQRRIAIRRASGHEIVALIEIVSPGNKDRSAAVEELANKLANALRQGIHVLLIDVLPPGPFDPHGLHAQVVSALAGETELTPITPLGPLVLASYAAGPEVRAYLEPWTVGEPLPELPLFLRSNYHVMVPLEVSYQRAWADTPAVWRDVLEPLK